MKNDIVSVGWYSDTSSDMLFISPVIDVTTTRCWIFNFIQTWCKMSTFFLSNVATSLLCAKNFRKNRYAPLKIEFCESRCDVTSSIRFLIAVQPFSIACSLQPHLDNLRQQINFSRWHRTWEKRRTKTYTQF